ncbi:MAG TPA: PIG-L family deacetylase [Chitinophagaceae bacterium]|nr:PIG-L family deacetylase [Chitinophagaceae bacterium]
MKKILAVCLALYFSQLLSAQAPLSRSSSEMYMALRKLNVLGTVLYVAAHPDDENTRLITYFSKEKLYRTGYLSLTRGDGGQNLIGDEQGVELGLIRTQELLAARRIDGGEQFFTRAYDFGYSKTPEETLQKWDREKILSDVVWIIRRFQPDVIITRFPVTGEGGHGHHTSSAILANEAFRAAADPSRFPEQLKYTTPWQAKRILFNSFVFGNNNTTSSDQFKVDMGGYSPLLGKSYGEIAAESRSQHKSQGFGVAASRGESLEYFLTTGGSAPVNDLMDGVQTDWKRVPGSAAIQKKITELIAAFDLAHPEASVPGLVALHKMLEKLPDGYWKQQKQQEVQQLIAQCSGLFWDITTRQPFAVQTDSLRLFFTINSRLGNNVAVKKIAVAGFDTACNKKLGRNQNFSFVKTIAVKADQPLTQPYWLQEEKAEGIFRVADQRLIGQADVQPSFEAAAELEIAGQTFIFKKPVQYKYTDPVRGELYQPLVVVPPVLLTVRPEKMVSANQSPVPGTIGMQSMTALPFSSVLQMDTAIGKPAQLLATISPVEKDRYQEASFLLKAHENASVNTIHLDTEKGSFSSQIRSIHYQHIPDIHYFKPATIAITPADIKIVHKKIGYITGAGDKVPEALEQMGYEVTLLGDKELARLSLDQFDAIITGIRAYNTHNWMNTYYDKLMKYVADGGNLVVQYNTSSNIGPVKAKMGPYSFDISRTRVTDENAAVSFINPQHPVLNYPNKISAADFDNWIQERSIYHAGARDKQYEPILSMGDANEPKDDGSLIIARHGKGYFTYTGLVFFRQLPAAVPGAYRLLANIIALNDKKAF